ncbi:MAG: hypothetical protein H7269_05190 [Cellulomonas sp.]|nr:hypothetical protein [Cellulomonas sp.]
MPAEPFCSDELMAYPDQLDFGVRQRSCAATRLLRGFEVRTPSLARPWVDFMFGVPEGFRGDRLLHREIQKFAYPRLVSLPATIDDGGSTRKSRFTRTSRRGESSTGSTSSRSSLASPAGRPTTSRASPTSPGSSGWSSTLSRLTGSATAHG